MNRIDTTQRTIQAQLDRLVGGDLPESERAALLAWLDEDCTRWRNCGLAFLEAQLWEEATNGNANVESPAVFAQPRQAAAPAGQRVRPRFDTVALAAVTLIAFLGGIALARWLPRPSTPQAPLVVEQQPTPEHHESPVQPLVAAVSVRTNTQPGLPLTLQLPVSSQPVGAAPPSASAVSNYDRQKWAKRGFEVHEERRLLPATLPDGRPVVVPVNKVRLEYKGTPVS